MFCKKGVLRNFTKFTGKYLCQRLFFNKEPATLLKKSLWHRCFPVNFVKFLRTPFYKEHLWWLLLRIIDLLKSLKNQNEISGKSYYILYPSCSYGLGKIHKALEKEIPTFCPIFSAIGTSTCKLAKFCDKLLKSITTNECTVKDLFPFAKEVEEFNPNRAIASFDIKYFIETIGLCVENLYRNKTHLIVYQKVPHRDPNWLIGSCAIFRKFGKFKPVIYRRYVGDTSLLFRSKEIVQKFKSYQATSNTNLLSLHLKLKKIVRCHFYTLK